MLDSNVFNLARFSKETSIHIGTLNSTATISISVLFISITECFMDLGIYKIAEALY